MKSNTETESRVGTPMIGWGLEPAMHADHDYLASTGHVTDPERDYRNFKETGAAFARSGLRTRHANPAKGVFDFEEAVRQARVAESNGIFVWWDLCHYDYPRFVSDPWGPELVDAFAELGAAFADRLALEGLGNFGICVWNEIVLWSSAVDGRDPSMPPLLPDEARRGEWRRQGIRSTVATMKAVRAKHPNVPFLIAEPCVRGEITGFLRELRAEAGELTDSIVIGLNVYPLSHAPETRTDPIGYFTGVVEDIRAEFPHNTIIFSETSTVDLYGLPDRLTWLETMLETMKRAAIEQCVWYPALDHEAWHDASVLHEHGGWSQDAARTPFPPLLDAVRRVNGVAQQLQPAKEPVTTAVS